MDANSRARARRRLGRGSAALTLGAVVSVAGAGQSWAAATAPSATATQTPVEADNSYYVTSTNPTLLFDMGCTDGKADAKNTTAERLTILDFGGQYADGSGTEPVGGPRKFTNDQIATLTENYALGWYICLGSNETSVLTVGVGTNNSLRDVSAAGGAAWAHLVATIAAAEAPLTSQVVIDGADDIETEFSTPAAALAWAAGYGNAGTGSSYLDYGDAGGCPETTYNNGACNNGWNQYDVWEVSWGEPAALPLPEIYYAANAAQWTQISRYGKKSQQGSAINFTGALSESAADPTTLNPAQSWTALTGSLKSSTKAAATAATRWLTNIAWETR